MSDLYGPFQVLLELPLVFKGSNLSRSQFLYHKILNDTSELSSFIDNLLTDFTEVEKLNPTSIYHYDQWFRFVDYVSCLKPVLFLHTDQTLYYLNRKLNSWRVTCLSLTSNTSCIIRARVFSLVIKGCLFLFFTTNLNRNTQITYTTLVRNPSPPLPSV